MIFQMIYYHFIIKGDMIVGFSYSFQMGVNLALYICEAHNFTSKDWINIGELAEDDACYCDSQKDQVKLGFSMKFIFLKYLKLFQIGSLFKLHRFYNLICLVWSLQRSWDWRCKPVMVLKADVDWELYQKTLQQIGSFGILFITEPAIYISEVPTFSIKLSLVRLSSCIISIGDHFLHPLIFKLAT